MGRKRKNRRVDATGRSIGPERHVRLHHWLLRSVAYRDLRPVARALLVEVYALYNGSNNGDVFLSVRRAAALLGVTPNTASGALRDLAVHGFIRARQPGGFGWKERHATTWVLTEFAFAGALPEKAFMRWQPGDDFSGRTAETKPRSQKSRQPVSKIDTEAAGEDANCIKNSYRNAAKRPISSVKNRDTGSQPYGAGAVVIDWNAIRRTCGRRRVA